LHLITFNINFHKKSAMTIIRILLHSFVLVGINFSGILVSAWGRHWLQSNYSTQALIAVAWTIILFPAWMLFIKISSSRKLLPKSVTEYICTYILPFVWAPSIFIPLHYVTQGYLTSIGNIVALWTFQAQVNFLALSIAVVSTYPKGSRLNCVS